MRKIFEKILCMAVGHEFYTKMESQNGTYSVECKHCGKIIEHNESRFVEKKY